eukprot:TRINITY_DN70_c0_g2_i1.p1 TRINITY_DN70_c0_g2~~TRINITY_DN70_c0_g2_i1.p1  ORF type:complete len:368 (-),score=180.16 TRINITY_DN70_c0_g2_i1:142-1245(-)
MSEDPKAKKSSKSKKTSSSSSSSSAAPSSPPNASPAVSEIYEERVRARDWDFKDFEQQRTLGTGTFGRVYLVRHKSTGKFYAMKILKKSLVIRLKQQQHVEDERAVLMAIDFPFIVALYKSFRDNKNLYLIFEFVKGGELFTHLRTAGRFSIETTRFYAAEIVLVLEHLHQRNIVYRDLKPENLLLDYRGHIKFTDFGFAKIVPDKTWTLCGTPEYLAPEIIKSKGHGKEVDWWALGILIFEMLAGYPPFYDESPYGIYEKILLGRVQFPSHFDSTARDLVKKLLAKDKTKRLGNLKDGAEGVKRDKFFRDINWDDLKQRLIQAPIVPDVEHDGDASNFEEYEEDPGYNINDPDDPTDPYAHLFESF